LCLVLCGVDIISLAIYAGYNIIFNIKFNKKQVKLERQSWELKKEIQEVERVNGKEKKDIEELEKARQEDRKIIDYLQKEVQTLKRRS
jgi:wobble nucleotide-excising tRNase